MLPRKPPWARLTGTMSAPKLAISAIRSGLIQSGMKMVTGCPSARPSAANEMPVLPLVASAMRSPGLNVPVVVGLLEDEQRHPVLDAAGEVQRLVLGEDAARLPAEQDVHGQQRGVANQAVQGMKAIPDDRIDRGLQHGWPLGGDRYSGFYRRLDRTSRPLRIQYPPRPCGAGWYNRQVWRRRLRFGIAIFGLCLAAFVVYAMRPREARAPIERDRAPRSQVHDRDARLRRRPAEGVEAGPARGVRLAGLLRRRRRPRSWA